MKIFNSSVKSKFEKVKDLENLFINLMNCLMPQGGLTCTQCIWQVLWLFSSSLSSPVSALHSQTGTEITVRSIYTEITVRSIYTEITVRSIYTEITDRSIYAEITVRSIYTQSLYLVLYMHRTYI